MRQFDFLKFLVGVTLLLVVVSVPEIHGAKILALVFFSSKSHKLTYMPLLEELAARGHDVTIVSPVKQPKPIKNVREVHTMDIDKLFGSINFFEMKESGENAQRFQVFDAMYKTCEHTYDLPHVKALLNETFDLVFTQPIFNDCTFGMVHKLGAPLVLFTPTGVPSLLTEIATGGHFPSSFNPNFMLTYPFEMTFFQRFTNFGMELLMSSYMRFVWFPRSESIYREKLNDSTIPSVTEILSEKTALILSNGHFSSYGHKPMLPDVVDIGGIHSRPAKPLPKDLEDFVSGAGDEGFIYFSMGSALRGDSMPPAKRKVFLRVFSRLKQRVLWKWESETMEGEEIPKNVKLSSWLPQQDLLGHSKIRIFITHCGGGSTEESIFHGTPLLGLPMFGDQMMNAHKTKRHGFLVQLEWNDVTEEALEAGIRELLDNPQYATNAKRISSIFRDQPDQPLARGIFWIEYILRHKGAPHLRSASRKLNYFQYHSYDVMAAYLTIIFTILYLIFAIIRFVLRCICGSSKKPANQKLKKK